MGTYLDLWVLGVFKAIFNAVAAHDVSIHDVMYSIYRLIYIFGVLFSTIYSTVNHTENLPINNLDSQREVYLQNQ